MPEKQELKFTRSANQKQERGSSMIKEANPEAKEEIHSPGPSKLLEQLLKPKYANERINAELLKKKKRKRQRLHL